MQNQAYSRLLNGGSTPSPPASPRRSSPKRVRRTLKGSMGRPPPTPRSLSRCGAWMRPSLLLRRQAIFLFAPLIYVSGLLFYMGTVSLDSVPSIILRQAPGSVYRSPQLYQRLRQEMDANFSSVGDSSPCDGSWAIYSFFLDSSPCDGSWAIYSFFLLASVWKHNYKGGVWRPCLNMTANGLPESNGYIFVEANGGLNQQRASICNAVALAGYLNATLVIPNLHLNSIWKDPSKFSDIYDEDYFISSLENEVCVVRTVPEFIMERYSHNMSNVYNFKIKAWSPIRYYEDEVLPKLLEDKFIRISPFANRLSSDAPSAVQRLRCLANFNALRFSKPIVTLAEQLVSRLKECSTDPDRRYMAVHLRFEEDMVAFSCCVFDGGEEEKIDLDWTRERGWPGRFTRPGRVTRPGVIRISGKCPLTPLEVGLMLRGMGFNNNTLIYLASGKIYNQEKNMAPLFEMFPLLQTKQTLASAEELAPFKNYSSRMAAIDYTVCLHSEVFVTTQGGNFPHFLIGHRRYLNGGHSKTIKPDKRKLALLFDNQSIGWKALKRQLINMRAHNDAKGVEIRRRNDSIYSYPCPDCMCRSNKPKNLKPV